VTRASQGTDSDGNSDEDQRVQRRLTAEEYRRRIQEAIAAKRGAATKQKDETDEYVLKRLISQGHKLNEEHIQALVMCYADRDEMITIQYSAAEIIRQSVDAEFHTYFNLSYTDTNAIDIQGTMYLISLMMKFYGLDSTARATQLQRIETAIGYWGNGAKDQHFDPHQYATVVLAEFSAYEKVHELTSGPKDTKKSVHEISILILRRMLEFDYMANASFAEQLTASLEQTPTYSSDDILSKVVDHYNSMKAIGPAKCNPSEDKQLYGKDSKKKGDK
jgi:hypothetical protein